MKFEEEVGQDTHKKAFFFNRNSQEERGTQEKNIILKNQLKKS